MLIYPVNIDTRVLHIYGCTKKTRQVTVRIFSTASETKLLSGASTSIQIKNTGPGRKRSFSTVL